jgi:hypothetical protein
MTMKDDDIKILIEKSTIYTSGNFTDELMMKLEARKASLVIIPEKAAAISLGFPILIILGFGLGFMFMWVFDLLPAFNLLNYHLNLGSIPIMIIILLTLLLCVNHLLKLKNQANSYFYTIPGLRNDW